MLGRHFITFLCLLMVTSVAKAFLSFGRMGVVPVVKRPAPISIFTNHRLVGRTSALRPFCAVTESNRGKALQFTGNKTLLDTYQVAVKWLEEAGLDDAEDSARHLVSHATNIGTRFSDFHNSHHRKMSDAELQSFARMCQQRADRMPVQYIIGNWDFYGLTFRCQPPILIPRPETEELVESIMNTKQLQAIRQPRILDVGAGTGAVGVALLSQLPAARCCSIDINIDAVRLARRNAETILDLALGNRYNSYHVDFVSFVKNVVTSGHFSRTSATALSCAGDNAVETVPYDSMPQFDIIVSNPPYIPSADLAQLQPEILRYEDPVALDGGADGLDIVKDLIFLAPLLLSPHGTRELWLEVSETHPKKVEEWLKSGYEGDKRVYYEKWVREGGPESSGWDCKPTFVSGIVDLVGNPRFIRIKY